MDPRHRSSPHSFAVYSPLQNTAVWLGAWLYGVESADNTLEAMFELGGQNTWGEDSAVELLRAIRAEADLDTPGPALRLVLWGPGQPAPLPPGSEAARALGPAGCIVVRGREESHILIPEYGETTSWRWFDETARLPEPEWLSPGDADALLTRATNEAADLIAAAGGSNAEAANPRLLVGTLADFYDTPGLPSSVSPRSAKLFARADSVAAIVETVTDRLGEHSFDPQLLGLWRHIRSARMAGVANAMVDYARGR